MSELGKINDSTFVQKYESKKEEEAKKEIEEIVKKLQNTVMSNIEMKHEIAKLNSLMKDNSISMDLIKEINEVLEKLENMKPELDLKLQLDQENIDKLEEAKTAHTGEGISADIWKSDDSSFDEYDHSKISKDSTISTFL
jgi:aspartate/tyrosine/aromatic aminotransferase